MFPLLLNLTGRLAVIIGGETLACSRRRLGLLPVRRFALSVSNRVLLTKHTHISVGLPLLMTLCILMGRCRRSLRDLRN